MVDCALLLHTFNKVLLVSPNITGVILLGKILYTKSKWILGDIECHCSLLIRVIGQIHWIINGRQNSISGEFQRLFYNKKIEYDYVMALYCILMFLSLANKKTQETKNKHTELTDCV